MNSNKELNWDELNHSYQPSDFSFRTTDEVEITQEMFGQEDALDAIRRGLRIRSKGYNIYICETGNKRIDELVVNEIKKIAVTEKTPMAIGYVYNFHHPEEPLLIEMKSKDAVAFKQELEELTAFIKNDIPILINSEEVLNKQDAIVEEFEALKEKYYLEIEEKANELHVLPKRTEEGIQFAPLNKKGDSLGKKEFLELPQEEQNEIMERVLLVQEYADEVMEKLEKQETKYSELFEEVQQEAALREVGAIIKKIIEKYSSYDTVKAYINDIAEDLLEHIELIARNQGAGTESKKDMTALLIEQGIDKITDHYAFNLMITPEIEGAPIICDNDYPQLGLNGRLLLDADGNTVTCEYTHIRPGLLHYANGGYLILHMQELAEKTNGWQTLKYTLRNQRIRIESNEELGISLARAIRPQPIYADMKVILIGNSQFYDILDENDDEFKRLFKIKVDFKEEIKCDKEHIVRLAGVIKYLSQKEGILPVSTEGLLKLIRIGNRKADDPQKIPSDIEAMMDILRESQIYAKNIIEVKDIETCLEHRERYEKYLQERLDESINDSSYLLDTQGERVGQVNGLAVYSVGDLNFGRPIRITATTYKGKQGIVDIENEAKLSGSIHTKGIHIISGFLGNQFAQDSPLSLSCNICFEQSYLPIDGDSASSAELYAILSSLSQYPIRQYIAVTGSVNQFGEIQPIGGVNEKIEGFFKVCEKRGLTGKEGVVIPKQNARELLLQPEVIEAIKNKQFHIYAIGDIWEGAEIMMNTSKKDIILKVKERLKKYNE